MGVAEFLSFLRGFHTERMTYLNEILSIVPESRQSSVSHIAIGINGQILILNFDSWYYNSNSGRKKKRKKTCAPNWQVSQPVSRSNCTRSSHFQMCRNKASLSSLLQLLLLLPAANCYCIYRGTRTRPKNKENTHIYTNKHLGTAITCPICCAFSPRSARFHLQSLSASCQEAAVAAQG